MTDEPLVEVEGLAMSYGDRTVLRDVTFSVRRGEVLALLGPNGAGKTTTVEVLEGFRMRSGGRVRVLGVDPARGGEDWRARIGVVLQSWRDHGTWKVRELLAHLGSYYAAYSDASHSPPWNADELIAAVGLNGQAHTRIRRLSGGQRRRLDVAIGLVGRPEPRHRDAALAAVGGPGLPGVLARPGHALRGAAARRARRRTRTFLAACRNRCRTRCLGGSGPGPGPCGAAPDGPPRVGIGAGRPQGAGIAAGGPIVGGGLP